MNDTIVILGGSGFLGQFVLRELIKTKVRIIVISRHATSCDFLRVYGYIGQVTLVDLNVFNLEALGAFLDIATVVINLVGVMRASDKVTQKTNGDFPMQLAICCAKKPSIRMLIHISALAVENIKTSYAISKLIGEQAVLTHFSNSIVLKPSIMFGENDKFLTKIAKLIKIFPALPVVGAKTFLQPVYAGDVAACILQLVSSRAMPLKRRFQLAGPEKIKVINIYETIGKYYKLKRFFYSVPFWIGYVMYYIMKILPMPLLIAKQEIEMLKENNVLSDEEANDLLDFHIAPLSINAKIAEIL